MDESSSVGSGSRGKRRQVIAVAVAAVAVVGLVGVVLVATGTGAFPRQGAATTFPNPILAQCDASSDITAPCSVNGQSLAGRDLSGSTLTGIWGLYAGVPSKLPVGWGYLPAKDNAGFYLVGPSANLTNADLTYYFVGGPSCTTPITPGFDLTGTNFTGATIWSSGIYGIYGACATNGVAKPAAGGITVDGVSPTLTGLRLCSTSTGKCSESPWVVKKASLGFSTCWQGNWRAGALYLDASGANVLSNCAF